MSAGWVEIGRLDDIPKLGARTVRTGGLPIALFRTSGDEVFALIDHCPHKGGPLSEGIVSGRTVTCPLHNWVIDLQNGQAMGADVGCTPTVQVRVTDGQIFLARTAFGDDTTNLIQQEVA